MILFSWRKYTYFQKNVILMSTGFIAARHNPESFWLPSPYWTAPPPPHLFLQELRQVLPMGPQSNQAVLFVLLSSFFWPHLSA